MRPRAGQLQIVHWQGSPWITASCSTHRPLPKHPEKPQRQACICASSVSRHSPVQLEVQLKASLMLQEGAPLQLNMWGINIYTGGHYDHYIVNYFGFSKGPAPEGTFDVPDFCPTKPEPGNQMTPHHRQAGLGAQLRRLLPNAHSGEHCSATQARAS